MPEPDNQLIAAFNARRSEEAFAALVRQHVNLVFATALRQAGDAGAAEEITQNVFVALAQSAGKLGAHPTIAGWLYQTTLNKSREWLRSELRRRRREQTAVDLELATAEGDSVWSSLVPLLDEALLKLREPDRLAVILHFMEGQTYREVGAALGVGEDAARKRVNGCLGQLTDFFRQRGFTVPALAAGAPLFTLSSHAAPAGLASSVTTAGLAAAHSTATTSTFIKGALKIMAWSKVKTAITAGAIVLLAAGTATVTVSKIEAYRAADNPDSWRTLDLNEKILTQAPPQVRILPTKFLGEKSREVRSGANGTTRRAGINATVSRIVSVAYGDSPARTFWATAEPQDRYDFICTSTARPGKPLQDEIRKELGLVGSHEPRQTDVLLLTVKYPNASGLKPNPDRANSHGEKNGGQLSLIDCSLSELAVDLQDDFNFTVPIIDRTGITQNFDITLKVDEQHQNPEGVKQALLDQLGLELVPTNMPVKMLVVNKAAN